MIQAAFALGIDGGGTKTTAALLDGQGNERGRGSGGPCNIATGDPDDLREAVRSAVLQAFHSAELPPGARIASVCAGVAGYTARKRRAEFERILHETISAERRLVTPDFVIAHWGASEGGPGVTISAGTGAVAYGTNSAGEACRADGRGWLLGDCGSAFSIGRAALRAAIQRSDAGLPATSLDRRIFAAISAEDADDLIEWVYRGFQPARIAALAEVVLACAEESDAVPLLSEAAESLAHTAWSCCVRLNLGSEDPIYRTGGLLLSSERMQRLFEAALQRQAEAEGKPAPRVMPPRGDPARGAALLALNRLGA